ncbi:MAG: hypothetical protein IJ730_01815 [Alphaproteobacteria bacterium]|nr:hypothetical protein [Alphaproteobacteria bacterium]
MKIFLSERHYKVAYESLKSLRILNNIFDVETGARKEIFENLKNKKNKAWLEFQFGYLLKEFGFLKKSKEILQRLRNDTSLMPELDNWNSKFLEQIASCDWSRIDSSKNEEAIKFLTEAKAFDESKRLKAYEILEKAKEEYDTSNFLKNTIQKFFNTDQSGTDLYDTLLLTDKILAKFYYFSQISKYLKADETINLFMPLFMLSIDETSLIKMLPEKYYQDVVKLILGHWRQGFKIESLPLHEQAAIRYELVNELEN